MTQPPAFSRRAVIALGGIAVSAVLGAAMAAPPAYAEGTILGLGGSDAVAGSYIVVLKPDAMSAQGISGAANTLAAKHGGSVAATFTTLRGFSAKMSETAAKRLAADPSVAYVQTDMIMSIDGTQSPTPSYGLDRIDQRNLPLNNTYNFPDLAANSVSISVIDTGVLTTHQDFGGRAAHGRDTVSEDNDATDCHGHGTHVAGTTGGSSFGIAKNARIFAVRVLGCTGSGTTTDIVQGIDFVTNNQANTPGPDVSNMSLGGGANTALDNAVTNSVAAGVVHAIAAGNSNANACNFSPARAPNAITVGATTSTDARASFSNFGTCVDIFAPGNAITSAWFTSNTATNTISGTSMASPHVAGAAAVIRSQNPSFTPAQVRAAMVGNATSGVVGGAGTGSPNLLLFVGGTGPPPGVTVFFDNFETATGWVTNPLGTDNATTGQWVRGDPAGTASGITLQLGTTVSGTNDLVTGAAAGASAGEFDVDGGTTTIRSPSITLPSTGTLNLSFSWYLAHLNNATTADFFRVSVNGTQVFQQLGAAANRAGAWATASVSLNAFAGQSIQITVSTADAATASLIEAGVDDVRITQN